MPDNDERKPKRRSNASTAPPPHKPLGGTAGPDRPSKPEPTLNDRRFAAWVREEAQRSYVSLRSHPDYWSARLVRDAISAVRDINSADRKADVCISLATTTEWLPHCLAVLRELAVDALYPEGLRDIRALFADDEDTLRDCIAYYRSAGIPLETLIADPLPPSDAVRAVRDVYSRWKRTAIERAIGASKNPYVLELKRLIDGSGKKREAWCEQEKTIERFGVTRIDIERFIQYNGQPHHRLFSRSKVEAVQKLIETLTKQPNE
jgi:hypothetical protein